MKIEPPIQNDVAAKAEILLHPVRTRIIEIVAGRELTAYQIAYAMPDIAQTTLYRHLKLLVSAGYLKVVSERPIRGTVEKLYALGGLSTFFNTDEASTLTADGWMHICKFFAGSILGDFSRYIRSGEAEPIKDAVGFNKLAFDLTPEERDEFLGALRKLFMDTLGKPAGEGRNRYSLGFSFMPSGRIDDSNGKDELNEV